jgi:hypothetical protein
MFFFQNFGQKHMGKIFEAENAQKIAIFAKFDEKMENYELFLK